MHSTLKKIQSHQFIAQTRNKSGNICPKLIDIHQYSLRALVCTSSKCTIHARWMLKIKLKTPKPRAAKPQTRTRWCGWNSVCVASSSTHILAHINPICVWFRFTEHMRVYVCANALTIFYICAEICKDCDCLTTAALAEAKVKSHYAHAHNKPTLTNSYQLQKQQKCTTTTRAMCKKCNRALEFCILSYFLSFFTRAAAADFQQLFCINIYIYVYLCVFMCISVNVCVNFKIDFPALQQSVAEMDGWLTGWLSEWMASAWLRNAARLQCGCLPELR